MIVSEDGLRPDVLDEQLTPRHFQLIHEGSTAREARTIRESDTLPSHAAMLSGFGAEAHGLHWNSYQPQRGFIHVPTVFSVAKANHLTTAMIVGKPKLRHIAVPRTVDHFERPSYLCGGVAKRAGAYFTSAKPDLMFVHFSDPDEYGHSHGWMSPEYLKAVGNSDKCLATLLDAIDHGGPRGDDRRDRHRRSRWPRQAPLGQGGRRRSTDSVDHSRTGRREERDHHRADGHRRYGGDDARRARSRQGAAHGWLLAHQVRAHDAAGRSLTPHA